MCKTSTQKCINYYKIAREMKEYDMCLAWPSKVCYSCHFTSNKSFDSMQCQSNFSDWWWVGGGVKDWHLFFKILWKWNDARTGNIKNQILTLRHCLVKTNSVCFQVRSGQVICLNQEMWAKVYLLFAKKR